MVLCSWWLTMVKALINLYSENTYIITEKKSCLIVDPGAPLNEIKHVIDELELTVKGILLTHGHFDHIFTLNDVFSLYKCPVYINEKERDFLFDPNLNLSSSTINAITFKEKNYIKTIKEGDIIELEHAKIKVIETPGHTRGGVCYLYKRFMFTGDTLFQGTIGRHDLPTSNKAALMNSLKKLIKVTRDNTVCYPGHGNFTTIIHEKEENPYIKSILKG